MAFETGTLRDGNGSNDHLPPGQKFRLDYIEAPAHDAGSFLVPDICDDPLSTEKRSPAPLDAETGMPLLIAPRYIPKVKSPEVDFHHLHGRLHDRLGMVATDMTPTEELMRRTYGQRVLRTFHNGRKRSAYHRHVHQASVSLLEDERDQLGAMVLPHIGHVPRLVADTSSGEFVVRPMTGAERGILHIPRQVGRPTAGEVSDFRDKWVPQATPAEASYVLSTYRANWAQYSYRDIDNGNGHVRSYLTDFFLNLELADENSKQTRRLLEKNDQASDETLLRVVVAALSSTVTVRGEHLASLYPRLLRSNTLYEDMPETIEPFLSFRLANPLGGIALSPARRAQLLGRAEEVLPA